MSRSHELQPEELELVSGGSTKLFSNVSVGPVPSHNYGLISDSFSAKSYSDANALLQQFNAPTREALYGPGNNPGATSGMISRPGERDLPSPADTGGWVTLQHGDGFAVNTTIPFEHPLEGTISRNLVSDFHADGGYQVLTLGQGQGGAQVATIGGTIAGGVVGALLGGQTGEQIGSVVGGSLGQNASHLMNPELGAIAFSQLDDAMLAHAQNAHNPNLDLPSGLGVEKGYLVSALSAGVQSELGLSPVAHGTDQQNALYALAHDLNTQGPVTGSFALSANDKGVYHFTQDGSKYYEMDNGHLVEKQVDESSGVDAAVALTAQHAPPQTTPEGDIHLPDPPAPITELPPELTPHDGAGQSGPDHADSHGADPGPADAGHAGDGAAHGDDGAVHASGDGGAHSDSSAPGAGVTTAGVDPGSHAPDAGNHSTDPPVAPVDTAPAPTAPAPAPADPAPAPVDPPPVIPVDPPPVIPIQVDVPPPVVAPIPVPDVPPPVVDPIPVPDVPPPVVAPDPVVDSTGGVDEAGVDPGFDAGGFDAGE